MTPLSRPSGSSFFEEFHCRECGGQEAYRSRTRGFLEKYLLPFLLLQPVRCERCLHRTYTWISIPTLERAQTARNDSPNAPDIGSQADHLIASADQRDYTDRV